MLPMQNESMKRFIMITWQKLKTAHYEIIDFVCFQLRGHYKF